jgi:serine/threonine-protein kinase HipA
VADGVTNGVADAAWAEPTANAPSTHIFKVGIANWPDSDAAEFVTTRAAGLLGLPVPHVELRQFDGERALVVERYDRVTGADGRIVRLHQEDLCQALGLPPTAKYEADLGPGVKDIAHLLERAVTSNRAEAVERFGKWLAFNFVTGSPDGHAKNLSLLHQGGTTALAPFYDLIAGPLAVGHLATDEQLPGDLVHEQWAQALSFGRHRAFRDISAEDLGAAAADLGVTRDWFAATVADQRAQIVDAVAAASDEIPDIVDPAVTRPFPWSMRQRIAHITPGLLGAVQMMPKPTT